eukprot:EG_transcript_15250
MAAATARPPQEIFAHYDEWLAVYERFKTYCAVGDVLAFLQAHPAAVNNRKGNLQGNTLLHQAMFWGCDKGIIASFKDFGADPHLQNWEGKTPAGISTLADSKRSPQQAAELIAEVYGPNDAQNRAELLRTARLGMYAEMMPLLREHPHLVNTQAHPHAGRAPGQPPGRRGWAAIHQVAFHGVSEGLLRALVDLGASLELRTYEGETADDIHRRTFPHSKVSMAPRGALPTVSKGGTVAVHPRSGAVFFGTVLEVDVEGKTVKVKVGDREEWVARCRVTPQPVVPSRGDCRDLIGVCSRCFDPRVPPGWTISPNCTSSDHPYCADCLAEFLWSEFKRLWLTFRCGYCQAPLSLDFMPGTRRGVEDAWPPGKRDQQPKTGMDFAQFEENVKRRLAGAGVGREE